MGSCLTSLYPEEIKMSNPQIRLHIITSVANQRPYQMTIFGSSYYLMPIQTSIKQIEKYILKNCKTSFRYRDVILVRTSSSSLIMWDDKHCTMDYLKYVVPEIQDDCIDFTGYTVRL